MYFWHYPFYSPMFLKVSGREERKYEKKVRPTSQRGNLRCPIKGGIFRTEDG